MGILAIDPGQAGAFVFLDGKKMQFELMPLKSKDVKDIDFDGVRKILARFAGAHVMLERAVSFGMGPTACFNYGRGFATLEIALQLSGLAVTYVEPSKWAKVMHEGIAKDLKPKAKSIIAVERLFPQFLPEVPKSKTGKLHEGIVDALLIAGFGLRTRPVQTLTENDF